MLWYDHHKRLLTHDELAAVHASLGVPVAVEYLDGGMFASAYLATLDNGTQVVVKAAPTAGPPPCCSTNTI
jgi:hypothetical protein